jgi:UDP-N-acetylglucosamine transferase subunit ALG13
MIFVTVGTDLPFDRMVRVIDEWAGENRQHGVFAQIGEGGWQPQNIRFANLLQPLEFIEHFKAASVIISHAGMGTILSALHHRKPILVMPKRASLGEQRNEHQLATARHMMDMGCVNVAFDAKELREWLDRLDNLKRPRSIGDSASGSLVRKLRDFIFDHPA